MPVAFLLLWGRLVWVVRSGYDGGCRRWPQGGVMLCFFVTGSHSVLGGGLRDLGRSAAQHEELLVHFVLEHLHALHGAADHGLVAVVGLYLVGGGASAQRCGSAGLTGRRGLKPDVVLDVLPTVGGYTVEDLLRVALVGKLALAKSSRNWFDLLLLGTRRWLLREDDLGR